MLCETWEQQPGFSGQSGRMTGCVWVNLKVGEEKWEGAGYEGEHLRKVCE
jgi:hypothetical protein